MPVAIQHDNIMKILWKHVRRWHYHTRLWRGRLELYRGWRWEVLFHTPHSPDLSPCDYDLIPKMKELLRDIRFQTVLEILLTLGGQSKTSTEQELLQGYYDFHIAGNEFYSMLAISLKECRSFTVCHSYTSNKQTVATIKVTT
ncbi:hypothetical protein L9F63_008445 [Diploptera punctata]|uniref:Uncharacterized protein n=1 Tax=Diploptera punctata TaxID=6984 RepID=A0AAD7Z511_DIPPU|nr:hypothetical protein L9F63_008445 [Diploptera punctata]